jgi:hypothetical protein
MSDAGSTPGPRPPRRRPKASASARRGVRASGHEPEKAPAARHPARPRATKAEERARRALISGSALLLLGLAMLGVDSSDVGAAMTLIGLAIMSFGVHTFGRLGVDEP